MDRDYNEKSIERDFVDEDGWLTDSRSEGGKRRLTFEIAHHKFRIPPKNGNPRASQEIYEEILRDPANVSVVLSNAPKTDRRAPMEPYSCILASICDAAGLIRKGRSIVCLMLEDYKFADSIDGSYSYYSSRNGKDLFGSTAEKHDEMARKLISLGAELVVAPSDWDGPAPKCHVTGWSDAYEARDYATILGTRYWKNHGYARCLPIIDADTPELRKIAGAFAGDESKRMRKVALSCAKEVFVGLALEPPEAVDLLSYGLIGWDEAKSKSYKVPIWKKEILRPSLERFPEFNGGQGHDSTAEKLSACTRIWRESLNAYGISFKEGRESHDVIVRVWKEIGNAIGVDSSIEAVLVHGVPVDDVIAAI